MRAVLISLLLLAPLSVIAQSAPSSQPAAPLDSAPRLASQPLVELAPYTPNEEPDVPGSNTSAYRRSLFWTAGALGASALCYGIFYFGDDFNNSSDLAPAVLLTGIGLNVIGALAPSAGYLYAREGKQGVRLGARRVLLPAVGGFLIGAVTSSLIHRNDPPAEGFLIAFDGVGETLDMLVLGGVAANALLIPLAFKDIRAARSLSGSVEKTEKLEARLSLTPLFTEKKASMGLGLSGRF